MSKDKIQSIFREPMQWSDNREWSILITVGVVVECGFLVTSALNKP